MGQENSYIYHSWIKCFLFSFVDICKQLATFDCSLWNNWISERRFTFSVNGYMYGYNQSKNRCNTFFNFNEPGKCWWARRGSYKRYPDISVPSAATLQDLAKLEKKMHALAQPVLSDPRPVNLVPLGYADYKNKWNGSSGDEAKMRTPFDYSLTFAFQSARRRLCIINGELYLEGTDLPDSGKILKIESKRVLIKKNGRKKRS